MGGRGGGCLNEFMNNPLKIAVASGKGGTGKTTIATGLAFLLHQPKALRDSGLFGVNGLLIGLGAGYSHDPTLATLLVCASLKQPRSVARTGAQR